MKKSIFALLFFAQLGCGISALAQGPGSAGVLFLLIQPAPRANGMANASVASTESGALGIVFNPAHLGRIAVERYLTFELYPSKTNWLPQLAPDLKYDAKTILVGYNFKHLNKRIPVSFGVAYSRVFIDLGKQIITGELDPMPLGVFHSTERANVWSIGVGVDYLVKASLGLSFKDIESNLAPRVAGTQQSDGRASATARDFGVLAYLPFDEVFSKLAGKPFEVQPGIRPFLGTALGYSKSNIGDKITYVDAAQADPLPRTARIGTSLKAGLSLITEKQTWRLVSFENLYEAEQLLVRNSRGKVSYAGLLGDIDFWDNVILRKGNSRIVTKKGWELNLFELLSLRNGRYEDPLGRVSYDTDGIGFSLLGVLKAIRHLNPQLKDNAVLTFLTSHVDVQYNRSDLSTTEGHPLNGTKFKGISISVF